MRILDRYILKSIITTFIGIIFIFFFLYVIIDIFSNLDEFIKQKVIIDTLKEYYFSLLPIIFTQTSPLACLLAVLFSLGRLSSNNEIIAMRTAGLNFWQITKPVITFGLVVSVLIFLVNEKLVPQAISVTDTIKEEKIEAKNKENKKIDNLTFYGLKNRLYFIDAFYPNSNTLEGITILGQDKNQSVTEKIVALKGVWQENKWKFYQCQVFYFDAAGQIQKETEYFEERIMDITESPSDFLRQRIQISVMNIQQLKDYIFRFSESGAKAVLRNLRVDLHQKIAYPFTNLGLIFVVMPLALMMHKRRGTTFISLGIGIGLGFLGYFINAVSIALGKAGILLPFLAAWTSNIIFFLFSAHLIRHTH